MHPDNDPKSFFAEWLEKLQEESWQLELLISGLTIFGLFELGGYLQTQLTIANANLLPPDTTDIGTIILSLSLLGTNVFIINLLVHLIIRSLWIGALGLRYVSGDIDYDSLRYNNKFITYYKRTIGSFDKYIIKLENFSSIIFSYTFILFFIFCSAFIFMIEVNIFGMFFSKVLGMQPDSSYAWIPKSFSWLFLFLGALVAFDFITLGLLKKIKQRHFATFYFYIYKFIGILTLSFLWRPLLLNFLDQQYTRRLMFFIVPYIAFILFILPGIDLYEYGFFPKITSGNEGYVSSPITHNIINKHAFNPIFYDDMMSDDPEENYFYTIKYMSIPSHKVAGELFEVFVKYDQATENYISAMDSKLFRPAVTGYSNQIFNTGEFTGMTPSEKNRIIEEQIDLLKNNTQQTPSAIRDSLEKVFEKQEAARFENNLIAIKAHIQNTMLFSIDSLAIAPENITCDFYIHPHAKEKGMLCYFPIQLKLGRHLLKYRKVQQSDHKNQGLDTLSFSIPFIYTASGVEK